MQSLEPIFSEGTPTLMVAGAVIGLPIVLMAGAFVSMWVELGPPSTTAKQVPMWRNRVAPIAGLATILCLSAALIAAMVALST